MDKATLRTFEDYKAEINSTRARGGSYWANIVASQLRSADEELGKDEANRLIRECKLTKYGWVEES
ncbi:hypothetical protein LCGC14_3097740 [marine sediment metagenome]|uniref:Uncharacterized protein n=1 Tax=marine sediment metagenome TaxID=412755 RepID=A0A0F8W965_9ZZZZ